MSALYDTDYTAWLESQIKLIRNKDFEHLDMEHLLEEMEDMGGLRNSIESHLTILLMHKLKQIVQPSHNGKSWNDSIVNARFCIYKIIKKNPGLKNFPLEVLNESFKDALRSAAKETGIDIRKFPSICPWEIDELIGD